MAPTSADRVRRPRSRGFAALVLVGYVAPLVAAVLFLTVQHEAVLGVALLVAEGTVVSLTRLAARPPKQQERVRRPGEPLLGLPGDVERTDTRSLRLVVLGAAGVVALMVVLITLLQRLG